MLSLGTVFVLFIYGVAMRYLFNRPISWVDEAVTVLMVWSVLWTAALNLRWSEHISFDVVFIHVSARSQRLMLLVVCTLFVLLMLAALPGMVDYNLVPLARAHRHAGHAAGLCLCDLSVFLRCDRGAAALEHSAFAGAQMAG